jgi:hypothetical protein
MIPDAYNQGVSHIESLTVPAMVEWLRDELFDRNHILGGQADDYPVQAILNHFPHLSIRAQARMAEAMRQLVIEWKGSPTAWTESAIKALLSLATELPVPETKPLLQSSVEQGGLGQVPTAVRAPLLRAIAGLSGNGDRTFWMMVATEHSQFAGMAFQVLARVAPGSAVEVLGRLPHEQAIVDTAARVLPEFIARFPEGAQFEKLEQVAQVTASLPDQLAARLKSALMHAGYTVPESRSLKEAKQRNSFRQATDHLARQVSYNNSLDLRDAT